MVSVLIANSNVFTTDIILKLIIKNPNIKLLDICHDGNETLEDIYELNPDVCVLDLDMPNKTGLDILNEIKNKNTNLNCKFIIFSDYDYLIQEIKDFSLIKSIIPKGESFNRLLQELNEITEEFNYSIIKNEILHTLSSFCFNTSACGTKYLIDCIIFCLKYPYSLKNLSKYVYPIVAKQNSTSADKIVWNINRSIKSMWRYTPNVQKVSEFFNLESVRKPNIKNIISTFIDNYEK